MLSRPANLSAKQASHYYEQDDYYSQEKNSQFSCYWHGKAAKKLGLEGVINSQDFQQLLEGYSCDGRQLHAKPIDAEKHRAATDYVFSAPKSVSVAALVQGDQRLVEAHDRAVQSSLQAIEERYTQVRVRNGETGQRDKICTGNIVAANYRHETSRNLDPQLHTHCVVINATQNGWQWQAISNELPVQNQKLLGQIYQNDLAYQAKQLGYEIEPRSHGQFELTGYSSETLKAFSSRRQEIENRISQSGEAESVRNFQRAAIQTRSRKTVLNQEEKRDRWDAAIEQQQLELPPIPEAREIEATETEILVQREIEQLVEQEGAFRREQLEQHILENSLGQCPFREIEAVIDRSPDLVKYGDKLTTLDRLDRLTQLEQLLGLDDATNKARKTEQAGRTAETDSDRDSGRTIGISIAERLAATLSTDRKSRDTAGAIDYSFSHADYSGSETGIEPESVVRGVTKISERATLNHIGNEIAATLESSCRHLAEFAQFCDRLNQLIQHHRNRVKEKEKQLAEAQPQAGSTEWTRTEFVLNYANSRLQQNNLIWIENDRYWAERNPDSGEVLVGKKTDNQVIAQGRLGATGWDIFRANVEFEDWTEFVKSQQRQQRELQRQPQKTIDQSRSPSREYEIGD